MEEKPIYQHNFDCCRFLATCREFEPWRDVYLCGGGWLTSIVTVMDDHCELTATIPVYMLGRPGAAEHFPGSYWGYRLAKSRGLL